MSIISLSIPQNLLSKIDETIKQQGFANRSEIIRQALRAYLTETRRSLKNSKEELRATITLIYRKDAHRGQIMDLQHNYSGTANSNFPSHSRRNRFLYRSYSRLRGEAQTVRNLIQALKSNKQVSEVKATISIE